MIYVRDKFWFFIYYPGFVILTGVCIYFVSTSPEQEVWYGNDEDNEARIYASEEEAIADKATDILNVKKYWKLWFGLAALNMVCMMLIGIFYHCQTNYRTSYVVRGIYYIFGVWWLAMWGYAQFLRFTEPGDAVC